MPSETAGWQPDAAATIVSDLFQRLRTVQADAFQVQVEAAQHATARALEAARSLLRWRPTLNGGADVSPGPAFETAVRKAGFSIVVS